MTHVHAEDAEHRTQVGSEGKRDEPWKQPRWPQAAGPRNVRLRSHPEHYLTFLVVRLLASLTQQLLVSTRIPACLADQQCKAFGSIPSRCRRQRAARPARRPVRCGGCRAGGAPVRGWRTAPMPALHLCSAHPAVTPPFRLRYTGRRLCLPSGSLLYYIRSYRYAPCMTRDAPEGSHPGS